MEVGAGLQTRVLSRGSLAHTPVLHSSLILHSSSNSFFLVQQKSSRPGHVAFVIWVVPGLHPPLIHCPLIVLDSQFGIGVGDCVGVGSIHLPVELLHPFGIWEHIVRIAVIPVPIQYSE